MKTLKNKVVYITGDTDIKGIEKLVLDLLTMHPRTLLSKIEVRPTRPDLK